MAVDFSGNIPEDYPALNKLRRHYERRYDLQQRDNQEQIDRLDKSYKASLDHMKKTHEANEAVLQDRLDQSKASFEAQKNKLQERIGILTEEFKNQSEDQRHEFAGKINNLSDEYDQAKANLIQAQKDALAERDERYHRKLTELSEEQQQALQRFVDEVNTSMSEDQAVNAKYRHTLKAQQKALRANEERKHNEELQELRNEMARRDIKNSKNLRTMREEFRRERELDNSIQNAAIQKMRRNYNDVVTQLKQDTQDQAKAHGVAMQDKEEEIANLKSAQQRNIDTLTQKHAQELELQRTYQDRLNKEIQTAAANEVEKAQEKAMAYKAQVADSYNRHLKNALNDQQEQLDKYIQQTSAGISKLRNDSLKRQGEIDNRRQQEVFQLQQEASEREVRDRQNYDRLIGDERHQHAREVEELNSRHAEEQQKLKDAYNDELAEMKETVTHRDEVARLRYRRDRARMQEEKAKLIRDMTNIKEDQSKILHAKIQQQTDAYNTLRKNTAEQLAANERMYEKHRQNMDTKIENLEKQHARDRNKLAVEGQAGLKEKVAQITARFQDEMQERNRQERARRDDLIRQHESVATAYKNEITRLNQRQEELSAGQTSSARKALDSYRREMQNTVDNLEKQAANVRDLARHEVQQDLYRINMAKDVARFEDHMNQKIKNNQDMYQQNSIFQKRVNNLKNALDTAEEENHRRLKETQERFANYLQNENVENTRQRTIERINNKELMASKTQTYEARIDELNRSYENLMKEQDRNARRTLRNQRENYEKQISDLHKAHARELKEKLDAAAKSKASMEQELRSQNKYTVDVYEKKLAKLKETYARDPNIKPAF